MKIGLAFSYMFKDGAWFYKVFVGGLLLVLSLTAVGIPFILGYEVELIRCRSGELALPDWKEPRRIFRDGVVVLMAALFYFALMYIPLMLLFGASHRWPAFVAVAAGVFFWMPLVMVGYARKASVLSCFSPPMILSRFFRYPIAGGIALLTSFGTVAVTLSLGWMSLIVGWPFVVFWGISVQAHLLGQLARV